MPFPIQQGLFRYDLEDHFAILGVPLDADGAVIRQQYLKIAYRLHPDTCKATTETEIRRANKVLSKLVNPAYETLSREKSRLEFKLVLSQTGKQLAQEIDRITLVSEEARQLVEAKRNVELVYRRLMQPLVAKQYDDLEKLFTITAQLSELNLVFLILKQGEGLQTVPISPAPTRSAPANAPNAKAAAANSPESKSNSSSASEAPAQEKPKTSPLDNHIKRAKDRLESQNYSQAVLELRQALKLDPNNSTCHALLGLTFLEQNQIAMAKVHITKAVAISPHDPLVSRAKHALKKVSPESFDNNKSDRKDNKGGLFGKLFGKNKK